MNKDTNVLINEFKRIANKVWIKSTTRSFGGVGLEFEKELGKKKDSLYFPDYYGIELKCTSDKSKYPLYLLTLAFDGPTFPEINRIVEKYGYSDKDYPQYKVLATNLSYKYKTIINNNVKFQLHINDIEEKLYLDVYNLNNVLIERKSFVYIDSIKQHLLLKLNKLALITAKIKKINDCNYFHYYKIKLYELSDFNNFIYLLKKDIVKVSLISRIEKTGNEIGRYRNKNLVFQIKKDNIQRLFTEIYSLDVENKK